jgi:arsenate reductase-like glutaredoxin family protein
MKTVYAIPNCNTVKKALDWLKANKVSYEFHDYKKIGITSTKLTDWSKEIGWEALINKKGALGDNYPRKHKKVLPLKKRPLH